MCRLYRAGQSEARAQAQKIGLDGTDHHDIAAIDVLTGFVLLIEHKFQHFHLG